MKKKDSKNYLDFIPEKNPEIEYETGEDGIITVLIEWKGFYHKLAQRFFRRPRVSEIKLDKLGTFVWNSIDDKKDVHVTRLIKYLEILHDNHLIYWKGEKRK
ncbi:MAG: pyrroloquinoline quinone biosynthesis protein [Clostridiales bacterium 41_21_two_genomes]|nr:MAG: pyrroloquinoline quinone biosynthesis protein [Clostridiales bacterium 41_21_two_genomes]